MRSIKWLLAICLLSVLLHSCLEVNEEIDVNKNGSGKLLVSTDMGKLLEMLQAFMPEEEMAKSQFSQVKDTLIRFRDFVDTASDLNADTKAALRDGTMRMQMNMAEKKFRMDMSFPFRDMQNLATIYENMGESGASMGQALKGLSGGGAGLSGGPSPDMKQPGSFYDLETGKGYIARKLNKAKYAAVMSDSMMQQMKNMGDLGGAMGEMKMNTVIRLPKRAKSLTGAKAALSADKKMVIIKTNMMDLYQHPEQFEFTVRY